MWTPAYDAHDQLRDGAWVAELTVVGPGLCAVLVGLLGPPGVQGVMAAQFGAAALVAVSIRTPFQPVRAVRGSASAAWLAPFTGFLVLARPGLPLAVSLFMAQTTMRGLLNVFVVLVATARVGASEAQAGALFIAMGVGGLAGAAVAAGLGPRRGSRWILLGIVVWGLAGAAVVGLAPSPRSRCGRWPSWPSATPSWTSPATPW